MLCPWSDYSTGKYWERNSTKKLTDYNISNSILQSDNDEFNQVTFMTGKELSSYAWVPFPRFWQNTNIPRVDHWCYGVKNYGVAIPVTLKYLRRDRTMEIC